MAAETTVDDVRQALYREAQLALRAVVDGVIGKSIERLEVARSIRRFLREKALKYSVLGENETTEGLPQQSMV